MKKLCRYVYLDKNYKESELYNTLLQKYSPDIAEKYYLQSMQHIAAAEYSVGPNGKAAQFDAFMKVSRDPKQIVPPSDNGNFYKVMSGEYDRTTNILSNLKDPFEIEVVARKSVIRKTAKDIKDNDLNLSDEDVLAKAHNTLKLDENGDGTGNTYFQQQVANTMAEYDFKREAGTAIHLTLEKYITEKLKVIKGESTKTEVELLNFATRGGHVDSQEASHQQRLVEKVYKTLEKYPFAGGIANCQFETEVTIWDDDMKAAGSIDLLVRDANGVLHIFDYKTKEVGKRKSWNSYGGPDLKIDGFDLKDNKENMASLQTGIYKEMLERKGFRCAQPSVIYIQGSVVEKDPMAPEGTPNNLYYADFLEPEIMPLNDVRNAIVKIFKDRVTHKNINTGVDLDEKWKIKNDPGKINSINEFIDEVSGDQTESDKARMANIARKKLNNIKVNKKNKKEYVLGPNRESIYFKSKDPAERKKQIIEVLEKYFKGKERTVNNVISIYNGNTNVTKNNSILAQIKTALSGVNKQTHELGKLNAFPGMSSIPSNFLVATNKSTGVRSVIIIDNEFETSIPFEGNGSRNTILGKYLTDQTAKLKYGKRVPVMNSTNKNFNFIKAAMAVMYLKNIDNNLQIDTISYNYVVPGQDAKKPDIKGMSELLPQVKALVDSSQKGKTDIFNKKLDNYINTKDKYDSLEYTPDYLDVVYNMLKSPIFETKSSFKEDLPQYIEEYRNKVYSRDEMVTKLNAYLVDLQKEGGTTYKEVAKAKEYGFISQAILQLLNVDYIVNNDMGKVGQLSGKWTSLSRISNELIQSVDVSRKKGEIAATQEFTKYKKKQVKVLKDFMEEAKVGETHRYSLTRSNVDLYKILYLNPEQDPTTDPQDILRLKSPDDLRAEGKPKAAAFVEFFNNTKYEAFKKLKPGKEVPDFNANMLVAEGVVPIMHMSRLSQASTSSFQENPREYMKVMKSVLKGPATPVTETSELENPLIKTDYSGQEYLDGRHKAMGIDFDGHISNPDMKLETNVELIMDKMYIDALRTKHITEALTINRAAQGVLATASLVSKISTDEASTFLKEMILMTISNEKKDEGTIGRVMDSLNNLATTMHIAGSPKQFAIELSTNLFASSSTMMAQGFTDLMGGDARFNVKDWHKAGAMLISKVMDPKITSILEQSGMLESDLEDLKGDEKNITAKGSYFNSKVAMGLNAMPLKFFRSQIYLSEMIHDGSINAYEYDKKLEMAVYVQERDPRFYDTYKKIKSADAKKRLDAIIAKSKAEGTLTEDGKLSQPYTLAEIVSKRDYYKDIFGGVGKEVKVLAQFAVLGRVLLKFKYWWIAKKDFYTGGKLRSKSRTSMNKIKFTNEEGKPDYYYAFEDMDIEGVWQTMGALRNNLMAYASKDGYETVPLNQFQKENLSKVMADLIHALLGGLLLTSMLELFDDDMGSDTKELLTKGVIMGIQDANFIKTTYDLATKGAAAPGISSFLMSTDKAFSGLMALITGDFETSFDKLAGLTAISKFGKAAIHDLNE